MTATSTHRLVVAFLLPCLLLLGGCTSPAAPAPDVLETVQQTPPVEPTDPATATPLQLAFALGDGIDPGSTPQWGDGLSADPDYTLSRPDDGAGTWAYTNTASQCTVDFWQGGLAGFDAEDDGALTDAVLAQRLRMSPDEIAPHVTDDTLNRLAGGTVDVRTVTGRFAGGGFIVAGRAFGAVDAGLIVDVGCPEGVDPRDLYAAMKPDRLAILVAAASGG